MSKELSEDEINRIIARFMGQDCIISYSGKVHKYPLYTESLDALVPVWGKLEHRVCVIELVTFCLKPHVQIQSLGGNDKISETAEDLKFAAAAATARAIMAMEEK